MSYAVSEFGWRRVLNPSDCLPGETWSSVEPSPSTGQIAEQQELLATTAIRQYLDKLAQSWDYQDYTSARTYRGDINLKYAAEALALCNYGSACYTVLDQIKAGSIQRPQSIQALLSLMPEKPIRPS